jgi:hypothetical protein
MFPKQFRMPNFSSFRSGFTAPPARRFSVMQPHQDLFKPFAQVGGRSRSFSTSVPSHAFLKDQVAQQKFSEMVPPARQAETLESFKGPVSFETAPHDKSLYRFFDEANSPFGRFQTEDPTQTRPDLALLSKWNKMHFQGQLSAPKGLQSFYGQVGPQQDPKAGEFFTGKGSQHYVPDTSSQLLENITPTAEGIAAYGERDLRYGGWI